MTALQSIVKEAKAIKKAYPKRFAKWTDYVRQASAIYASKHKGKSPVGKKKATKKVVRKKSAKKRIGKVDTKLKRQLKNQGKKMPHGYDVVKRTPRKRKIGAVKKKATTMHKDTKSHNVNIRVMSGVSNHALDNIKKAMAQHQLCEHMCKKYMSMPLKERKKHSSTIKKLKNLMKEHKTHIVQLKKHI